MGENYLSETWKNKDRRRFFQVTFVGTVLFGILAQGMGLFNKFSYHDDIFALFWAGSTIASGRWNLHVISQLETLLFGDGNFSLPLMNGMFSILLIAASACVISDLLQIRKQMYSLGLGCVMVSFPVITGFFGFMFTMPYYVLAMIMMVIAAWLICRGTWKGKLLAVILGGCSVGIYQAFLPLLLSLPLIYDMICVNWDHESVPLLWKKFAVQALCILGAVGFYFAMNRFFLAKFNVQLNTYMGIDQMESTPLGIYLTRAARAYREFFRPTRNVPSDMYPMHMYYIYYLMLITDLLMAGRLFWQNWKKRKVHAVLFAALFLLFPLANNFIYVMSDSVHGLMTYGLIAQIALFALFLDRTESARPRFRQFVSAFSAAVLAMSCWMYARFDNQCYLKAAFQQQEAISWFTELASCIKNADGYRADVPVVFLNGEHISDPTLYNIDELNFIHLDSYGDTIKEYVNSYAWRAFMERWCGFGPAEPVGFSSDGLPAEIIEQMPHYPNDGSIQMIGDVLVVNF